MPDNVDITSGAGTTVATDIVGTAHHQRVKVDAGGDGVSVPLIAGQQLAAGSFPVVQASDVGVPQSNGIRKTYRIKFRHTAVAGDVVELRGPSSGVARVTEIGFIKPSVQTALQVIKRSAADTGGTHGADPTPVSLDAPVVAATCAVFAYTAAPTPGTAGAQYGSLFDMTVDAFDAPVLRFGDRNTRPIEISTGQSVALNIGTGAVIHGWIEWTEAAT